MMTHEYYLVVCILAVIVVRTSSGQFEGNSDNNEWIAHSKQYGEKCINHDECVDFRMVCNSVCQCDQFHDWKKIDTYVSECVVNTERLHEFLKYQHEIQPSFKDKLSNEAHSLFVYLGLSGIVALSIGILFALACIVFVFTKETEQAASVKV